MSSPSTPLGDRTRIDVRSIEHELTDLWKQVTESPDREEGRAVTRVCVMNLVVGVLGDRTADYATQVIAELMMRHPNRSILVNATPDSSDELFDAWAQAHCQVPVPGRPQVCGEQITIEAHGSAVARAPGLVLSLLVPDVPVMLWWPRGDPFGVPWFDKLSSTADRVVIDSATFASPEDGLIHINALLNSKRVVSDLSWGRLTPWRELIAQFFDAPAMTPYLDEIERVIVLYEVPYGEGIDRSQALLLVGWLVSRLGWSLSGMPSETDGLTTLSMTRRDGARITIELRPTEPKDNFLDRIAAIRLECADRRFYISRGDTPEFAVARAEVSGRPPLQRVVRLEHLTEINLISEELRLLGRDRGFEGALRVAAGMVK